MRHSRLWILHTLTLEYFINIYLLDNHIIYKYRKVHIIIYTLLYLQGVGECKRIENTHLPSTRRKVAMAPLLARVERAYLYSKRKRRERERAGISHVHVFIYEYNKGKEKKKGERDNKNSVGIELYPG
jgi:hypothetical protein